MSEQIHWVRLLIRMNRHPYFTLLGTLWRQRCGSMVPGWAVCLLSRASNCQSSGSSTATRAYQSSGLEQYPAIITFNLPLGHVPGMPNGIPDMGNRYVGTCIANWRKLALKHLSLLHRKLYCNDKTKHVRFVSSLSVLTCE